MAIDHKALLQLRVNLSKERVSIPQSGVPELDELRVARSESWRPESWNFGNPRFERVQEFLAALWQGAVIHLEGWTIGPHQTATGGVEGFSVVRWKQPTPGGDTTTVLTDVFEAALVAAQLEAWRV